MKITDDQARREAWIIEYLYGELNEQQCEQFEQTLELDPLLKTMFDEQTELDSALPKGTTAHTSEERADALRREAVASITSSSTHAGVLIQFKKLVSAATGFKWQVSALALSFALGVFISSQYRLVNQPAAGLATAEHYPPLTSGGSAPQLIDAQLHDYNPNSQQVQFSLATRSESQISGSLEDREIRDLLASSLRLNQSDELRLQLIELFSDHISKPDIRQALIYSLLNDPNPGVRYGAVEHLIKLTSHADVRAALRNALEKDVNTGIRIEAFLALSKSIDGPFLKTLREHSMDDSNTLIRERSRKILKQHLVEDSQNKRYISI